MKAVILAAGEGRRLEPLTNRRPKPMVPVANKPLLEYVVEAVDAAGIDDVVLVVGHKRDRIQQYFGDGDDWGVTIEYALQEKQLGTGHAVLQAEPFVDEPFLVLNGDRIIEPDVVARLVDAHGTGDGATMAVTRSSRPSDYGVVSVDGEQVTNVVEKPRVSESEIINAGVYGFDPTIFEAIRNTPTNDEGEHAITTTIAQYIDDGAPVQAVRYRGLWIDVSYLWDLVDVNATAPNRVERSTAGEGTVIESGAHVADDVILGRDVVVGANATLRPGTTVGDNVTIGANVVLSKAVVFADAVVEDGAVLRDCIVAGNATVGPSSTIPGGTHDVIVDDSVHRDVEFGGLVGDNAVVGANVVFEGGAVLGDDAVVADGATLTGTIPTGADVRRG